MTHDDETVERVARAIWDVDAPEHRMDWEEETSAGKERYLCIARAALSAMPHAALMREALSALEPFAKAAGEFDDAPEGQWQETVFWADGQTIGYRLTVGDTRRARAVAQRLRDALTQENQP